MPAKSSFLSLGSLVLEVILTLFSGICVSLEFAFLWNLCFYRIGVFMEEVFLWISLKFVFLWNLCFSEVCVSLEFVFLQKRCAGNGNRQNKPLTFTIMKQAKARRVCTFLFRDGHRDALVSVCIPVATLTDGYDT